MGRGRSDNAPFVLQPPQVVDAQTGKVLVQEVAADVLPGMEWE